MSIPTPVTAPRTVSKSIGFAPAPVGPGGGGGDGPGSWRAARSLSQSQSQNLGSSPSKAPGQGQGQSPGMLGGQGRSVNPGLQGRSGPERTVGGFEKRDRDNGGGAGSGFAGSQGRVGSGFGTGAGTGSGGAGSAGNKDKEGSKDKDKEKEKDKDADSKASLAHVPCRFFKAGTCTAGDSCPFSHTTVDSGKREVCQWFLKGNCKFGHKCALAHVRPGEPMSMDRKNKKEAQRELKGGRDPTSDEFNMPVSATGNQQNQQDRQHTPTRGGDLPHPLMWSATRQSQSQTPVEGGGGRPRLGSASASSIANQDEPGASPVPIRSALSSSMSSPPVRMGSSPMREPFGPPSGAGAGTSPAGFGAGAGGVGIARSPAGQAQFSSSPSRPSPLASSFSRQSVPGPLSLRSSSIVGMHSPLRPPPPSAPNPGFSSSLSHPSLLGDRMLNPATTAGPPLSASFADGASAMRKNIWARSETPEEPLSPRNRPTLPRIAKPISASKSANDDVFADDEDDDDVDGNGAEDDHGEDLIPSSLSDLLTPIERARRMSRRDSNDSFGISPRPCGPAGIFWAGAGAGGERLAQSAGATMGPPGNTNFLQSLWSAEGNDARRDQDDRHVAAAGNNDSIPAQSAYPQAQPQAMGSGQTLQIPLRAPPLPSSPSARAVQEHAPGQSLPGGLASALSRLHLHGSRSSGVQINQGAAMAPEGVVEEEKREEHDEGVFDMDG